MQKEYLSDVIIENSLVEKGVGLYSVNDEYIMKGEVKNNFVQKVCEITGEDYESTKKKILSFGKKKKNEENNDTEE